MWYIFEKNIVFGRNGKEDTFAYSTINNDGTQYSAKNALVRPKEILHYIKNKSNNCYIETDNNEFIYCLAEKIKNCLLYIGENGNNFETYYYKALGSEEFYELNLIQLKEIDDFEVPFLDIEIIKTENGNILYDKIEYIKELGFVENREQVIEILENYIKRDLKRGNK